MEDCRKHGSEPWYSKKDAVNLKTKQLIALKKDCYMSYVCDITGKSSVKEGSE
jgi:hypothetical protein